MKLNLKPNLLTLVGLGVLLATAVACSKGEAQPAGEAPGAGKKAACPALSVRLDGEAVPWTHAIAYKAGGNVVTQLFSHEQVTCEQILKKVRSRPPGEQMVNIARLPDGTYVTFVPDPSGGVKTTSELVRDAAKAGDTMAVCLPEAVTLPGKGINEGKTLVVQGLLEATFCGEMK